MGLRELREGLGLNAREPKSRQIVTILLWTVPLICGPALGLVFDAHYPFLVQDRTLYIGAAISVFFLFLFSFVALRRDRSLPRFPMPLRIVARLGWAIGSTSLVWGLIGIVNGAGMPVQSRQVSAVVKHHTLQRDPAQRTYYIAVRPWKGSRTVVELPGPRATYDQLPVPVNAIDTPLKVLDVMPDAGRVTLVVGKGRFGLEWLRSIEPVAGSVGAPSRANNRPSAD